MTPTPEQLAAVLPRCSAGLDGGDWTDDDERLDWARRVLRYVEEANRRQGWFLGGPRGGLHISHIPVLRDHYGDRINHPGAGHYDRQRDGSWLWCPDSAPESPQSDANADQVPQDPGNDTGETTGVFSRWQEVRDGRIVITKSNDWPPPPAPGITYHDAEEAR